MRISIIVAAKNASSMIQESLTAWKRQVQNTDEIIVANASDDLTSEIVKQQFPAVKLIDLEQEALIPELWTAGILQSNGDLTAITIANCIPNENWIKKARILLSSGVSAAGGSIENHPKASLVDTAIYFCRYWRYMPPFSAKESADLPGDNAIYKTSDLLKYRDLFATGFWEPEINSKMSEDGLKLLLTPDLAVSHKYSTGILKFMSNRIKHGFHFGRERSKPLGMKRLLYLLASPAIPFLLWRRIWNAVEEHRAQKRNLLTAMPIIFLFLITWGVGEAFGYLVGPLKHEDRN